jgi:hypothetical protein
VDRSVPAVVSIVAFAVNVGAGRLRAQSVKLSVSWFLWIHLPIVAIFPIRLWAGLSVWFIPLLVAVALGGQWVGGRLVRNT